MTMMQTTSVSRWNTPLTNKRNIIAYKIMRDRDGKLLPQWRPDSRGFLESWMDARGFNFGVGHGYTILERELDRTGYYIGLEAHSAIPATPGILCYAEFGPAKKFVSEVQRDLPRILDVQAYVVVKVKIPAGTRYVQGWSLHMDIREARLIAAETIIPLEILFGSSVNHLRAHT